MIYIFDKAVCLWSGEVIVLIVLVSHQDCVTCGKTNSLFNVAQFLLMCCYSRLHCADRQ